MVRVTVENEERALIVNGSLDLLRELLAAFGGGGSPPRLWRLACAMEQAEAATVPEEAPA